MTRHVVGPVGDVPPGERKLVTLRGREIVVFNVGGEFFAFLNRCPHEGAPLCHGAVMGLVQGTTPGEFHYSRDGEILRCPWHGWEFDLRTGQSWCDPINTKARRFTTEVQTGDGLIKGPYVAETFPVAAEDSYIVVEV
jgi:nitrite reductase/ring-hydroxylating ferredoxin subunit